MIAYSEACRIIRRQASRSGKLATERVGVLEAVGRLSAGPLASPEDVPGFRNSAMDGFALRAERTAGAGRSTPTILEVAGCVAAGDDPRQAEAGEAWEIMTGAAVPDRADAVIKIEDVEVERDETGMARRVRIFRTVGTGENIRDRAGDFRVGQPVLARGARVQLEHLLALTSLGFKELEVLARPRVAVLSTGRELVPYTESRLEPGLIRNSTGPYLAAALEALGAVGGYEGIVPDDADRFLEILRRVLRGAPDVVISTGAVSMGKYDFVAPALRELGAEIFFHKAAIRPGKPILFARLPGGTAFFGVPGNPVSSAVGLRFFVEPYLRELQGLAPEAPIRARLAGDVAKPDGLRCFFKARVEPGPSGVSVTAMSGQASFIVSSLLNANAWVVLPESGGLARAGTEVDVYPLFPEKLALGGVTPETMPAEPGGCCS